MTYTDTRDKGVRATFREAVMGGMSQATGGLYVPVSYPALGKSFTSRNPAPSFRDVALNMARPYVDGEIDDRDLAGIIEDAYPFMPKIVPLDKTSYALELFHGPTCAFKDFGARFMARAMAHFNRGEDRPLHILVATSGDTGSAVGSAFSGVDGIDVTILYPSGRVSALQEKQLSTFTGNVRALRVLGSFDDCQRLVKSAFTDKELRQAMRLSSANSINIARLLPQSFYYMYASLAVRDRCAIDSKIENPSIIMSVPSGNFGNLTSGLIARKMGAPIAGFIAATNSNKTVPDWLATGEYRPRPSVETYANAMDVGAPSNYERMSSMLSLGEARSLLAGYWLDNDGIIGAIAECASKTGYTMDPHGAIAWKAWSDIKSLGTAGALEAPREDISKPGLASAAGGWAGSVADGRAVCVSLETASPAKFTDTVKKALGREPPMPDRLARVMAMPGNSVEMACDFGAFKEWLMESGR